MRRIALVSSYSWTHPGGVNRHVEALAREYLRRGLDVRVLAPFNGDPATAPDWLVPVGGTIGIPFNGAVSNVAMSPAVALRVQRELRDGDFDVVHVHDPVAMMPGATATAVAQAPLVATFHTYGTNPLTHGLAIGLGARRLFSRIRVQIAVSEAAAWTGRRFYGGDYRVIPNGVDLPDGGAPDPRALVPGEPLELVFVGQAVARKGLPVLLRAFEALRDRLPVRLTVIGAEPEAVHALLEDPRGVEALGRADDDAKHAALERAHILCAPGLGGESFGMILTEAFAAGTPVVASDIPGYRGVVTPGTDGLLVPAGDPLALATQLQDLAHDPAALLKLGEGAQAAAEHYAWPAVADQVLDAYGDAIAAPAARRTPAVKLAPLEPLPTPRDRAVTGARRLGVAAGLLAAPIGAVLAVHHLGWKVIERPLAASSPVWVLVALALMAASMTLRAVAWRSVLRAATPTRRARFADAFQGTTIGVLMSATLPARLGELSRALIVARRLGRPRDTLPAVFGTLVSQTLLNLLALVILGAVVLNTARLHFAHSTALFATVAAPVAIFAALVIAPELAGRGRLAPALRRAREGLAVFRDPRHGAIAAAAQLGAWAVQVASCLALFEAIGLDDRGAGLGAAAAVLFAVNVTAIVPATPSNIGIFQAACVAVLSGGYKIGAADALGFGIILQAVELATAVVMGMPSLVKEGVTWREVRHRALSFAPVSLPARTHRTDAA